MKIAVAVLGLVVTIGSPATQSQVAGPPQSQRLQFDWEAEIRSEDADYDLTAAAVGPERDGVWVVVGSRPKGRLSPPQGFLLWHLDDGGKPTLRLDINTAVKSVSAGYTDVYGIAPIGNRVAVVGRSGGKPVIAVFEGKTGQVVGESRIQAAGELFVSKAIAMSNGNLLLLGHDGGDGWLASVNESGKTIWEKRLGFGVVTILDGGPAGNDEFVLLGSVKSTVADPISWVGKVNAQGALVSQVRFSAFAESVAGAADGTSLLMGRRPGSGGNDVWTRLLTPKLEEMKPASTIVPSSKAIWHFASTAMPGRGWAVTGSSNNYLPWFGLVTSTGGLGWSDTRRYDARLIPLADRAAVVSDSDRGFGVFDLAILDAKAEQRFTVRVVKFKVQ